MDYGATRQTEPNATDIESGQGCVPSDWVPSQNAQLAAMLLFTVLSGLASIEAYRTNDQEKRDLCMAASAAGMFSILLMTLRIPCQAALSESHSAEHTHRGFRA